MARDWRRFDLDVSGREFRNLFKNRAAFEATRAAIETGRLTPDAILEQTTEGRRRSSKPILWRLDGRHQPGSVERALKEHAGTYDRRYYTDALDLLHVGDMTWTFTREWQGHEVDAYLRELQALQPDLKLRWWDA